MLRIVITHKLTLCILENHPVAQLHFSSVAGTVLLLLHAHIEALLIHRQTLLTTNEFCEVEWESERIEECERLVASNLSLASSLRLIDDTLQELDTILQRAEEGTFLFLHHFHHQLLLSSDFWEGITHLSHQRWHELIDERLFLVKEGIAVADSTTKDATNHITSLGIRWQLTISNRKGDGTQVIHHHAHGDVLLLILTILATSHIAQHLDEGLEHIGVVVRSLALQRAHQTLKAHTRINHLGWQTFEGTISLAVVLHEHEVPDLNHLWVVFVHQFTSRHLCLLLLRTAIHMNLRARSTRSRVTHFPEIVMLVAVDDVVFGQELLPDGSSLIVTRKSLLRAALEHSGIEILGVNLQHIHNVLPSPRNRLFLEVVTKRPVAQHLEHRVVVGVMSHLFEVVVLAAHTEALLRICLTATLRGHIAQNDVLELIHTCIGEHQRWVVLHDHRSRWHNQVFLALKKLLERLTYLFCCHHIKLRFDDLLFTILGKSGAKLQLFLQITHLSLSIFHLPKRFEAEKSPPPPF